MFGGGLNVISSFDESNSFAHLGDNNTSISYTFCSESLIEPKHVLEVLQVWFQTTRIKQVIQIFCFPCAYKSYIYLILSSIK